MRKLFRWHRGGLEESLATTIEVQSFDEIENLLINNSSDQGIPNGYFSNIRTRYIADDSARCGEEWKTTYYVIADNVHHTDCAVGMCNFAKE